MDFTATIYYQPDGTTNSSVKGTANTVVQQCLEKKTKEYLADQQAPECSVEFHTEADHIPHVTVKDLDDKHVAPLTEILNDCIK